MSADDVPVLTVVQGSTLRPFVVAVTDEDGVVYDVSGKTITGYRSAEDYSGVAALTGAFGSGDENHEFTWSPSSADVATAGWYRIEFHITSGGAVERTLPALLRVVRAVQGPS